MSTPDESTCRSSRGVFSPTCSGYGRPPSINQPEALLNHWAWLGFGPDEADLPCHLVGSMLEGFGTPIRLTNRGQQPRIGGLWVAQVLHLANSRSLNLDPFDLIFCEARGNRAPTHPSTSWGEMRAKCWYIFHIPGL